MKKIDIKKHYHDALYWATSTRSRDESYHITRTQEAILRKLIHYSTSNDKISYSNEIIAEHTFIGEESIKKVIPLLSRKGYISTASHKISFEGEFKTRRTIFIQWDKLKFVLSEIKINEVKNEKSIPIEDGKVNSESFQIDKEKEQIIFGAGEKISSASKVEAITDVNKNKIIKETDTLTEDKTQFQIFHEKCLAEGLAEKTAKEDAEKNRIITFDEFAEDYEIIDEIVEILSPILNLTPFMEDGKLSLHFNRKEMCIEIKSNDEVIKLPNKGNSYHTELFEVPSEISHLKYKKDRKPSLTDKLFAEKENKQKELELNNDPELATDISNDNDDDDGLPW